MKLFGIAPKDTPWRLTRHCLHQDRISHSVRFPVNMQYTFEAKRCVTSLAGAAVSADGACAPIGTSHTIPGILVPDHWHTILRHDLHSSGPDIAGWRKKLNVPNPNSTIEAAEAGNRRGAIIAGRTKQAQRPAHTERRA